MNTLSTLGFILWLFNPSSNQWQTAANWSPVGPPGQSDSALFLNSARHDIDLAEAPSVGAIAFNGLQAFRLRVKPLAFFTLNGAITSNRTPEFRIEGAYSGTGGQMEVTQSGSLGEARVIITGVSDGNGGVLTIRGHAGNPRMYVNRGAYLVFADSSDADHAFILAKPEGAGLFGGQIYFWGHSTAKDASIRLTGRYSALQAQDHVGSISVGQLSGTGAVFVGPNMLVLHEGDFAGSIDDMGAGGGLQFEKDSTFNVTAGAKLMQVSGAIQLAGTLQVYFSRTPITGQSYPLFRVSGSKSGNFSSVRFPTVETPHFTAGFLGDDYVVTILP